MYPVLFTVAASLLFSMSSASESDIQQCPSPCTCTVKLSTRNILVDCTSKNLTDIPTEFPSQTEDIHLDHNQIITVDLKTLPFMPQLKKIDLSFNQLKTVHGSHDGLMLPQLEFLDFSHNMLAEVPSISSQSLRTLHISHNNIRKLQGSVFNSFRKLKELYLDHNYASVIDMDSFHDNDEVTLANLEHLSLKKNKITSLNPKVFENLISLRALDLARNKISSVHAKAFHRLMDLEHIDLSYNRLHHVEDEAMFMLKSLRFLSLKKNKLLAVPRGLPMLEWLDLSHNEIRTIGPDQQADIYPAELLILAHNPLHCDCNMAWLKELFDRREYLINHVDLKHSDIIPVCASPSRVSDESWDNLEEDMFTCQAGDDEEMTTLSGKEEPHTLSVSSETSSDHIVHIHWSIKGSPSYTSVIIQYYIFGARSTSLKHIEVSTAQRDYALKHLAQDTSYVVCVIPKLSEDSVAEDLKPLSFDHCVEVVTTKVNIPESISYTAVAGYYSLGMLATLLGVFSCIGGLAVVYGMWEAKCSEWATKFAIEAAMPDLDLHTKLSQQEANVSSTREDVPCGNVHKADADTTKDKTSDGDNKKNK